MVHPDDEGFTYATDSEWDRASATEMGSTRQTQAWILTDRDVWYANPYYTGPAQRHPEDYHDGEDEEPAQPAGPSAPLEDLDFPF